MDMTTPGPPNILGGYTCNIHMCRMVDSGWSIEGELPGIFKYLSYCRPSLCCFFSSSSSSSVVVESTYPSSPEYSFVQEQQQQQQQSLNISLSAAIALGISFRIHSGALNIGWRMSNFVKVEAHRTTL